MKWNVVALFSLVGAGMGTLSLFGLTADIELFLWTIIALIAAWSVARITSDRIFFHGIAAGIGMGISTAIVQILFFEMYIAHNQIAGTVLRRFSEGITPQWFVLLSSPVVGGVYGVIIGALSIAASKFHHPN